MKLFGHGAPAAETTEKHRKAGRLAAAAVLAALVALLAGAAAADTAHTILLPCGGGGNAGKVKTRQTSVTLTPAAGAASSDGRTWTLEELAALPDFRLQGAALRCTVTKVQGSGLRYALVCGNSRSAPQYMMEGCNLWDVTVPVASWLEAPERGLRLEAMHLSERRFVRIREDSVFLEITFSTSAELPLFPLDRVREGTLYDASLSMLEEGSPFVARYDDTADSLLEVKLPLGVPYYYAGASEEKFLNRYFPSATTRFYRPDHLYLCGLDCVGMTRLVYEKCGLEPHPSIVDMLRWGMGRSALEGKDPAEWPAMLLPGDLICVKHGTYHVMMYLGTLRKFGWTERDAGEAAGLLDAPLVIHCGGNPFYYERYREYISEKAYRNTYPPDGGVTVSVIQPTDEKAPHSMDTEWGKHFGWYLVDGKPLLVFKLADCTELAWYGPPR